MGHTAQIRFTEPIDPRAAWEAARVAVGAPADWTSHGLPAELAEWNAANAPHSNLLRQSDPCGAAAMVTMFYRPEGALLDDSEYENWEPGRPPAGYLEIHLDTRWQYAETNLERAHKIIANLGIAAAMRDDHTGNWSAVTA